jgi:hypothetical protein
MCSYELLFLCDSDGKVSSKHASMSKSMQHLNAWFRSSRFMPLMFFFFDASSSGRPCGRQSLEHGFSFFVLTCSALSYWRSAPRALSLGSQATGAVTGAFLCVDDESVHRCWITSNYPRARIFLEYMFVSRWMRLLLTSMELHLTSLKMFVSAFFCAIIHSVIFLRLRGNLGGNGWRNIHFRRIPRSERWALKLARDEVDGKMYKVAMQLMWYDPLLYGYVVVF